ncbi:hypothetical protein L1887_63522 [Cichorium endivia]|nr:hypothetical protein L1887_63522 [Cichorium endivia]
MAFLVGGAICLVNSVNERDLSLLTSYVEVSLHGQLLRGTYAFQATEIIAIVGLQRGIPSKRESSARVDYVPALCTHRPSLLPIEWSGEVLGSRRRGRFAAGDVARIPLNLIILEEGEVVTSCAQSHPAEGTPAWASRIASPPTMHPLSGHMASGRRLGLPCLWCGWPKLESPSVDARLVVVEKTLVLCRVS